MIYQGRERQIDPYDFYLELRPDVGKAGVAVDKIQPRRLIPAGYNVHMLGVDATDPTRAHRMLKDLLHFFAVAEVPTNWYVDAGESETAKAVVEVGYSSVYGERWRIRSDKTVPEHR